MSEPLTAPRSEPPWRFEDLGRAVPDDRHAVSVALPTWASCVGYEEGDPEVRGRLAGGYPRFVVHPLVQEVCGRVEAAVGDGRRALVFPARLAAERCRAYCARWGESRVRVRPLEDTTGAWAALLPPEAYALGREYWQHAGEGLSSRQAEASLAARPPQAELCANAIAEVSERLAELYGLPAADVFLYPSGMAAVAAGVRVMQAYRPGCSSLQLGFPYVDVLKVQQRLASGGELRTDAADLAGVATLLQQRTLAGCVVETPGNPLLGCPDLPQLSRILRPDGALLLVDDTIAGPGNVDVSPLADLIASSLTKYFTGSGTVMAGSLVVPAGPQVAHLRHFARAEHEPLLWHEDAVALAEQSRTYLQRLRRIEASTRQLLPILAAHPAVACIRHPTSVDRAAYDLIRRPDGGYGGLFSIELHDPARAAARFYDSLRLSKGPSLGTDFTIVCPFTILAHYKELDWAESCGVSRYLLRVSIGLEPVEELQACFLAALDAAASLRAAHPG